MQNGQELMVSMRVLDAVGNTPVFRLSDGWTDSGVQIYVKAEYQNPGGSVKDRAAKAMILDGIRRGVLTKDKTIIDATSGNTGIAYAMIGAALGYRVRLTMPANVTAERKKIMKAYGARIVETDPLEGIDGAYEICQSMAAGDPKHYWNPDQYCNAENWLAHYNGTAVELLSQVPDMTHFVSGTGTSGTFMGCVKRFREHGGIRCFNMTPDSPFHGIEGIKHREFLLKNGFFDESVSDGQITVTTDEAYETARRLAVTEGLFCGISSGANVAAAVRLAAELPKGAVIVTILCDRGYRYLSGKVWE